MNDQTSETTTGTRARRFSARDAVSCVLIAAVLLVLCAGDSVRRAGEEMDKGVIRTVVLAAGHPAGWIADQLPFADAADQVTGWLSSDEDLGSKDGTFSAPASGSDGIGLQRVSPQAFSPEQLGDAASRRPLTKLLVTGDSLAQPLDAELARDLAAGGVRTVRDPHIGTGLSKTDLLDWGKLATRQSREVRPDAVVVFIGANEGFPMATQSGTVECCDARWAAEYATRARAMMETYRRGGAARVFWLLLPAPRDDERRRIARAVNAAVRVAAAPFGAEARVVDTERLFTPGGRYRDAMEIGGRLRLVREADGIHLNERGAEIAASATRRQLASAFDLREG